MPYMKIFFKRGMQKFWIFTSLSGFYQLGRVNGRRNLSIFPPAETSFQAKAALGTSHDEPGAAKDRGLSKFHLDTVILSCYSMST